MLRDHHSFIQISSLEFPMRETLTITFSRLWWWISDCFDDGDWCQCCFWACLGHEDKGDDSNGGRSASMRTKTSKSTVDINKSCFVWCLRCHHYSRCEHHYHPLRIVIITIIILPSDDNYGRSRIASRLKFLIFKCNTQRHNITDDAATTIITTTMSSIHPGIDMNIIFFKNLNHNASSHFRRNNWWKNEKVETKSEENGAQNYNCKLGLLTDVSLPGPVSY